MGADMLSSASVYSDRLWLRSSLDVDVGSVVAAAAAAAATAAAPFIMLMLFAALSAAAATAVVVAVALSVWQLLDAKTPLPLDLSM